MADTKISALTALTGANSAPGDLLDIVDVSDTAMAASGTNKSITREELQTFGLGTITTDKKVQDLSVTWNNAGVTFTGLKFNVTNTASGAASLLMDLQVGGVSKFSLLKTGQLSLQDGSVSAPAIRWAGDTDSGIFRYNNARTCIAGNGAMGLLVSGNEHVIPSGSAYSFSTSPGASSPDLFLCRDAANTLAQRNGTNAQTFNIYNTYTDASNYERGFMKWNSNVLEIGAEAAGTGTLRNIRIPLGSATQKVTLYRSAGRYLDMWNDGTYSFIEDPTTQVRIGGAQGVTIGYGSAGAYSTTVQFDNDGKLAFSRDCPAPGLYVHPRADDTAVKTTTIEAQSAYASAVTNIDGGNLVIKAGAGASGSAGDADGGDVYIRGGVAYGTGSVGNIIMDTLPTSASGLPTGALWNNSGVLTVA